MSYFVIHGYYYQYLYCRPKHFIPTLDPSKEREIRIQFNAVIQFDIWEWEEGKSSIFMRFGHKDLGNFEIDFGPCKILRLASNWSNTCYVSLIEMLAMVFMQLGIICVLIMTLSSHCGLVCHTNM